MGHNASGGTESGTRHFISFKDGQANPNELEASEQLLRSFGRWSAGTGIFHGTSVQELNRGMGRNPLQTGVGAPKSLITTTREE